MGDTIPVGSASEEMQVAIEENEEIEVPVIGDEELSEDAGAYIDSVLGDDETPEAVSVFDYGTKVLVVTDQRVLITDEDDGAGSLVLSVDHDDISLMTRDGRTLVIETRIGEEHRFRFGEDETVEEIVEIAGEYQADQSGFEDEGNESIAERVRFWEEQDKINQELIPRVIRQNELLTEHIAEHGNLPEVTGQVIGQALADAREQQERQYETALDNAKREIAEHARATGQVLAEAREEQRRQYEVALDAAKGEIEENARATIQALTEAGEEQRQQYETALYGAKAELNESTQQKLDQTLAAIRHESRRTRNLLIGITSGAVIIAVAALVVNFLA